MLNHDLSHSPASPRPLQKPDGKEMFASVSIAQDTDGIPDRDVLVDLLDLVQTSGVSNYIAHVLSFHDAIGPNPGLDFHVLFGETYNSQELCHS